MSIARLARKISCQIRSPVGIYTISFGIAGLVPFILLPLLTRLLSPEEFGQVTFMLIIAVVLGNAAGLGAHGYISVSYFKQPADRFVQTLLSSLVLVILSYTVLTLLLGLLTLIEVLPKQLKPQLWWLALISGFSLSVNSIFLAVFRSSDRPANYLLLRALQSGIEIILCAILLALSIGLWARAISYPVAVIASSILGLALCARMGFLRLKARPRLDLRGPVRFGLPMVPHVLAVTALAFADRVIVSQQLGAAALGIYMAAAQTGLSLMLIIEPANKAFAPWLFKRLNSGGPRDKIEIVRMTYLFFVVLLISAMVLIITSYFLFDTVVGSQFHEAKPLLPWVTMGFVFQGMYYMVVNYMFFCERTGLLSIITSSCTILAIAIAYWATRQFGLSGAAIAFTVINAINFICVFCASQYLMPMPWLRRGV